MNTHSIKQTTISVSDLRKVIRGQVITPDRFPLKAIHVPAFAPVHCAMAVPFQHPTTVVPSRICRRILAAIGLPALFFTTTVQRHG